MKQIRPDDAIRCRENRSPQTVAEYVEAIRQGVIFPPLVVFHDAAIFWLADGYLRYQAYADAGLEETDVDVRSGTRDDAIWFAAGCNQSHGLRRINKDKERAVRAVLSVAALAEYNNSEIARQCGVDPKTVSRHRSIMGISHDEPRTARRGGREYKMRARTAKKRTAAAQVRPVLIPSLSLGSSNDGSKAEMTAEAKQSSEKEQEPPDMAEDDNPDESTCSPTASQSVSKGSIRWLMDAITAILDEIKRRSDTLSRIPVAELLELKNGLQELHNDINNLIDRRQGASKA